MEAQVKHWCGPAAAGGLWILTVACVILQKMAQVPRQDPVLMMEAGKAELAICYYTHLNLLCSRCWDLCSFKQAEDGLVGNQALLTDLAAA